MQRPAALLVNLTAEDVTHIRQLVVHDAVVGVRLVEADHGVPAALQPGDEPVAAERVLGEQQREVGREPLAQPDIVPVVFGHRIAEPLMRDLVRDQPRQAALPPHAVLAVEDRRGQLHAAAEVGGLHVRQLLVRVRADLLAEELHHLAGGRLEVADAGVAVLVEDPCLQRHTRNLAGMVHGEARRAEGIEPRRDRHRLLPVRPAETAREIHGLLQ